MLRICQVAQKANCTTKTCQKVCLSQRKADRKVQQILMTEKLTEDNKRQCTMSYIKHLAVSELSRIPARIKSCFNLTGKCFEMPNISYT